MHLKRIRAPKFWKISRKERKWTIAPRPGPHKKFECIPLLIIVRDILHLAETGKEAKSIIKKGEILVDGKPRKDFAYPVGLFDVIAIPKIKSFYRVVPTSYGLDLLKIDEKESNLKICKIFNKTTVKKGKIQLNLNDGKNILADGEFKTGGSVLIELPSLKIVEYIPMEKNFIGIVVKGKRSGMMGKIKKLVKGKFGQPAKVICTIGNEEVEILEKYLFVVGKEKPLITVS